MISRRSYLALLTGGVSLLSGCDTVDRSESGTPTWREAPTPPRHDTETATESRSKAVPASSFDRVVDMVEDVGVDTAGETSVDEAFDSALADDTLLVFPEGEYKFERQHTITGLDRVGIVGRGNARIIPRSGWNGKLFDVVRLREFLFDGFDIDITHDDTTVGFKLACKDRFRVEDIEIVGRGVHPDDDVIHALNAGLLNEGRGVIRRLIARRGSAVDRYKRGDGRGGIYVGPWNEGSITIEDCHLSEFGNNGIYASRTPGDIRVIGGVYRNNNPSSVRISGRGSRVEDAFIEVDPSKYDGPPFDGSNSKLRGVVIEQKTPQEEILKPAGAVMRGCRVVFRENPTNGPPVVVWSNGKTLSIEDCRIHVENDTPAVVRDGLQKQGDNPPWRGERWVRLSNTEITGSVMDDCAAVRLVDAPGSVIRNCRIRRSEKECTGVEFVRSESAVIDAGSVQAGSYPVLIRVDDQDREKEDLISFVNGPDLEMVGAAGDGSRTRRHSTACKSPDDGSETATPNTCRFTWDTLPETRPRGVTDIGITGIRGRDVYFHLIGDSK